jgi:hypothetical protein
MAFLLIVRLSPVRVTSDLLGGFGINLSTQELIERYTRINAEMMSEDLAIQFGTRFPSDFAITLRDRALAPFDRELKPRKS